MNTRESYETWVAESSATNREQAQRNIEKFNRTVVRKKAIETIVNERTVKIKYIDNGKKSKNK